MLTKRCIDFRAVRVWVLYTWVEFEQKAIPRGFLFSFFFLILLINADYIKIKKVRNYAFYNFLRKKTTTVFRKRDCGLLNVGCSFLYLNMGSIIVAKKFKFAFDGPHNFIEIGFIMLHIRFNTKYSGFYVKFLELGKFARSTGFSTVVGEVLHWWSSCIKIKKYVILYFFIIK